MKVKFTKLAALLLAGVALFATGCTDYEVDIQKVDKKVDDLTTGKVATLESQVAGLTDLVKTFETIANHDADIQKLRGEMNTLETTLKTDYETKIQNAINDLNSTLSAAIDGKLDKTAFETAKQKIEEAIRDANSRIKDIEDADFQKQINDLITAMNNALVTINSSLTDLDNNKADKEQVAKDIQAAKEELQQNLIDAQTAISGQIGDLDVRVKNLETAMNNLMDPEEGIIAKINAQIDNINNVVIPGINQTLEDLDSGKLDKSDFDEYKEATAENLRLMGEAIQELQQLTKGEWDGKTIQEYIDAQDKILSDTFTAKYLDLVAKVFGTMDDMNEMKGNLLARLEYCEGLLEGEWGKDMTVKKYIDGKVQDLQSQITHIEEDLIPALDERLSDVEYQVYDVILPELDFALGYEGYFSDGLQGYIDDVYFDALLDSIDYTDYVIENIILQLNDILDYIYDHIDQLYEDVYAILNRIQSIVYVPDYDDLKITTNVSGLMTPFVAKEAEDEAQEEENEEEDVLLFDQPFQVTYKFTPCEFAPVIAENFAEVLFFNLKQVNTRDEEEDEEEEPYLEILDVISADEISGEVTFLVQAWNLASKAYVANANRPQYNVHLRDNGSPNYPGSGHNVWGTDHYSRGYFGYGDDYTWSIPVWNYKELKAYEARAAYAAALELYNPDVFDMEILADEYYPDDPNVGIYENNVSSNYNVLYPDLNIYTIPEDPYKKLDGDEDGDGNTDVRPFTEDEQHQTLPYNTLRKSEAELEALAAELTEEEFAEVDPGYRVILEDAVAVVIIDGKAYGLFEEDVENGFHVIYTEEGATPIYIPEVTISDTAVIEYIQGGENEPDEDNYIVDENTYAEVEMNGDAAASLRRYEIGNLVQGTYIFTSAYGSFDVAGDVLITKELGSIDVAATAIWTWDWNKDLKLKDEQGNLLTLGDALVDHNIFYPDDQEAAADGSIPLNYVRLSWPVSIDEEGAEKLEKNLGLTLEDFKGVDETGNENGILKSLKIQVADRPAEDEELTDDDFEDLADDSEFAIENVTIDGDELFADFVNFDWDKVYKVTAVYDLTYAEVTVNGTFTTIDRNREMVTLPKYEYTFVINKLDEETGFGYIAPEAEETPATGETTGADAGEGEGTATEAAKGYYFWQSDPMHEAIFKTFDEEGVINVEDNVDFAFKGDQDAFNEGELSGKINMYTPDGQPQGGTAFKYIDINKAGIYAATKSAQQQISAQDLKDMNTGVQDPNDPYTFLGKVLYRYITTYIGEVVAIPFQFNYKVPAYDFLHQDNYTFNDGNWYTMASPKYDANKADLIHYDVNYMNVPALAFNIIDENKNMFYYGDAPIEEGDKLFYDENLYINFYYTGPDIVDATELEAPSATDELTTYGNLWFTPSTAPEDAVTATVDNFEHVVFYYRSTQDAIPMYGTLEIECDGVRFEIPTSFEAENGGKYIAKQDYSDFELRAWKPFYVPTYDQTLYIDLDEHMMYSANVLEGLQFFDARQVANSTPADEIQDPFVEGTYSIEGFNYGVKAYFRPMLGFNEVASDNEPDAEPVWGWIVGNVVGPDGKTAEGETGNGYDVDAPDSWTAYDLQMKSFEFDDHSGVPASLKNLITVDKENYIVNVDYNSQIQFSGTAEISFSFKFQTPWQKFEKPFTVKVVVRGLDAQ